MEPYTFFELNKSLIQEDLIEPHLACEKSSRASKTRALVFPLLAVLSASATIMPGPSSPGGYPIQLYEARWLRPLCEQPKQQLGKELATSDPMGTGTLRSY